MWSFEVSLIAKYRKKISEHFTWLDELFQQKKGELHVSKELYADLTFEGFEYMFLAKSEEKKRDLLEEMNQLTYGTIPRTVMYQYELDVYLSFCNESDKLMLRVFLPRIRIILHRQLREIRSGSRPVTIYLVI